MVWSVLIWAGALASPYLFYLEVGHGVNVGPYPSFEEQYLRPALTLALAAPLAKRRPLAALVLLLFGATATAITVHGGANGYLTNAQYAGVLVVDCVLAVVAATRRRQVSVTVAGAVLVVQLLAAFAHPIGDATYFSALYLLTIVTAWVVGNSIRTRRQYAEERRHQAAAQAVTAERLRIARELHDMVAHSISIIAIQAGMGSRVIDTQPAEAGNALRTIEATSRETLAGLRRVLVGLRQTQPDGGSEAAPLGPAPRMADVDQLADATEAAGVQVAVQWRGERRPLPADLELSAFRIVQEAVTNVVRHADTSSCQVRIDYRDEELRIEVTDGGRGCPAPGLGYGIAGMRERVGLLHGEFSAGPRPEGGFRVTATLPLSEPDLVPAENR